jgi:hypothetical protein
MPHDQTADVGQRTHSFVSPAASCVDAIGNLGFGVRINQATFPQRIEDSSFYSVADVVLDHQTAIILTHIRKLECNSYRFDLAKIHCLLLAFLYLLIGIFLSMHLAVLIDKRHILIFIHY